MGAQYFCRAGPVCPAGAGRNPPVTASPCQPPLGKGGEGTGVTDCHSQCAHWLRNDSFFTGGAVQDRAGFPGGRPLRMRYKGRGTAGRCRHRPLRKRILWCVGEGLSCPPSCQPTDGHCRTRQSGHFLETGSLHPPLAALRRFPLPRATARVAPTDRNKECGKRGVEDAAPYVYLGSTQPLYSQFGRSIALCLAPPGTSLSESFRLLLCVIAFVMA